MTLSTPDPAMLAGYRRDLITAGLPAETADRIVIDAAAAVHRSAHPTPEVDDWTADEIAAMSEQRRAERAAETAGVAR